MFGEEDAGGEPVCFGEVGEFDADFVRVLRRGRWGGGDGGDGGRESGRETGETAREVENAFFETERCDTLDAGCLVCPVPDSQSVFSSFRLFACPR